MRERRAKLEVDAAVLALFCALAPSAFADSPPPSSSSQRDTQILSHQLNNKGSDESLRNAAVYAMQALMDLSGARLPSAFKNGYTAYGKYRNSENLDRLKDQNALLANSLGSVGAQPVLQAVPTITSFRRLDPSFLEQGDAGKIAAEFERQTGMSRKDFLLQLAEASERKIKRSDPMMIDKAFSRFESFLEKIPNAEFRKNAEKNLALVPDSMRRGVIAKTVQKLSGLLAGTGPATAPPGLEAMALGSAARGGSEPAPSTGLSSPSTLAEGMGAAGPGDSRPAGSEGPAAGSQASREPAGLASESSSPSDEGLSSSARQEEDKNGFGVVVVAALETQGQDDQPSDELSLFQQVSRRYRVLAPLLSRARP